MENKIMKFSEQILELQRETNMVAFNPLLDAIDVSFIKYLENFSDTDQGARRILGQMSHVVRRLKIQDIDGHKRLYGRYGEAKFYVLLKDSHGVQIEVLSERGLDARGGPDFRIMYQGQEFFAEVKSPVMLGGNPKYNSIMERSLETKIAAEDQARQTGAGIGVQVIEPHQKDGRSFSQEKVKLVIENLIQKFSQNYKSGQYAAGDTLALIYLAAHNFPLSGGPIDEKILAVHFDRILKAPISGELWSAAFGRKGMPVFCPPDCDGKPSIEGALDEDGILHSYPDVKAICFYVESFGQGHSGLAGLYRYEDRPIKDLVTSLTKIYNDDRNTETWRFLRI
jgi:hypothetical protein